MKQVMILGVKCNVNFGVYIAGGQTSLQLICAEDSEMEMGLGFVCAGEPIANATVALPKAEAKVGEVFIRSYGESAACGVLGALVDAGVVEAPHRYLSAHMQRPVAGLDSPMCVAVCMLTDKALAAKQGAALSEAA